MTFAHECYSFAHLKRVIRPVLIPKTGVGLRVAGCGLRVANPVATGFFQILLLKTGRPGRFYPSTQPGGFWCRVLGKGFYGSVL